MVSDLQVKKLFGVFQSTGCKARSALKADMCRKTAGKYIGAGKLPSEMRVAHTWRTRTDPFAGLDADIDRLLDLNHALPATEVLTHLQLRYRGCVGDRQLRTLQRRLGAWRAGHVAKEIFFEQHYDPGAWLQIDWTSADELFVTIAGRHFPHKLCHAMFPFSNWEWAVVCASENFASLQALLRQTASHAGGLPEGLQMDNSCTITHRVGPERVFNRPFQELLEHYSLRARTINIRKPQENGVIESAHRHFLRQLDGALSIRGSRDFDSIDQYNGFLARLLHGRNAARQAAWRCEKPTLHDAPARGLADVQIEPRRVSSASLISIDSCYYSVPSSYIGERISCRISLERVELFYAGELLRSTPRAYDGEHRIDWRHLIHGLVRKPGAFDHYKYRDAFFPAAPYRAVYARIVQADPADTHGASKRYLALLAAAAELEEQLIESVFELLAAAPILPDDDVLCAWLQALSSEHESRLLDPRLLAPLAHLLVDAPVGEAQHDPQAGQSFDRGHGHHLVLENPPPLAEHLVAAEHDAALLAAGADELEEHFHLLAPVLDVSQFVDIDHIVTAQPLQLLLQSQLPLGNQQALDQFQRPYAQYLILITQHQFPAQCLKEPRLAAPGQPESQDVLAVFDEAALKQTGQDAPHACSPQRRVGPVERLGGGQSGRLQQTRDPTLPAGLELRFAQLGEKLSVAPLLSLGQTDLLINDRRHGRQVECLQIDAYGFIHRQDPPPVDRKHVNQARTAPAQRPDVPAPLPRGSPRR